MPTKRRGPAGASWSVDETSLNVQGKWCSLYRAIEQDGKVVDAMVSEKRNTEAAQRFFRIWQGWVSFAAPASSLRLVVSEA